jgi:hypothetical protein
MHIIVYPEFSYVFQYTNTGIIISIQKWYSFININVKSASGVLFCSQATGSRQGSYVKLSSAVAAISVGGLKCRIQFWKGTTQGSSQQSLVKIGSVDSEENIFLISSPFFLFLAWWPSWLKVGITVHNFGRGLSKDHSTKVWLELTQWFLKRTFLCEFPIGFYVKLSSAVGAILVEGPNR